MKLGFVRQQTENRRRDVPGARWFKTDLHIHAIDDAPGGRVCLPEGVSRPPASSEELTAYARHFLAAAIKSNVQVIGLTPHCPRVGNAAGFSAAWQIVHEWNSGINDDGMPFREQIFAIFPGFKPRMSDGRGGLHLIFLFDPEIGLDRYLQLFDLIMHGRPPYRTVTERILTEFVPHRKI